LEFRFLQHRLTNCELKKMVFRPTSIGCGKRGNRMVRQGDRHGDSEERDRGHIL
jgi:hypothetical protein